VRKLEIVIPARLWERLEQTEQRTGVRKEDILMRAVVNIIEGVRCPACGNVFKEFG
jgi:hypothetical protein